ncbi:hypothetical protein HWV62_24402 [Athelia sp. TMB]|nr:hypothetical protein HWV62_24402 [Athelia sp. TMB]
MKPSCPKQEQSEKSLESLANHMDSLAAERSVLLGRLAEIDQLANTTKSEYNRIVYGRAAISVLPDEILKLIFEEGHLSQEPVNLPFELLVSAATQHWRRIALQTPRLWTRILCSGWPEELEYLNTHLQRSTIYNIDLIISINFDSFPDTKMNLQPYIQASPCDVDEAPMLRVFSFVEPLEAPFITDFEITTNYHDGSDLGLPRPILTGGAPVLRAVDLIRPNPCPWYPPLSNVTALYLAVPSQAVSIEYVHYLLVLAPTLISVEIHGRDLFHMWNSNLTPINLPSLRTLRVVVFENTVRGEQLSNILGIMNMPSLEFLSIRGSGLLRGFRTLPTSSCRQLQSLLWIEEDPNLSQFELSSAPVAPSPLCLLLDAFPSVERLIYGGPEFDHLGVLLKEVDGAADEQWCQLLRHALRAADFAPDKQASQEARAFIAHKSEEAALRVALLSPVAFLSKEIR